MKKVLFATTALVAFGGAAWADGHEGGIAMSGSAELGITYTDLDDAPNDGLDFVGDIGIDFAASGTSDSGITFGGNIELEHADGAAGDGDIDDFNVFVEGGFGVLTLGDVDSAYDKVSVGISTGGLDDEADYYYSDAGGDGVNDGIILRYDYTISGITLSASVEQGVDIADGEDIALGLVAFDDGDPLTVVEADNILSLGIGYSGDFGGTSIETGLGYQVHNFDGLIDDGAGGSVDFDGDIEFLMASVGFGFGAFGANVSYEIIDIDGVEDDFENLGISVDYTAGAITVGANFVDNGGLGDAQSFGLYSEYDLGGGLSVVGAISTSDISGDDELRAGFGFAMSF